MKWEVRTMRSGTSLFNGPVFKKTVLRYWPVWGAYSVIWLVALPLQGLMMLQLDAQNRGTAYFSGYVENFAQYTVPDLRMLSLVLAVVFGVLCAMAVCSHLYNPRSANFFGGLPVRREGLFVTHYLAGLAFLIVPNAVIFLLVLLIEAVGGAVFLPGLGFWLAVTCGECFFFYTMAVFCGMFTGHILALPAFYGIFNILASGVYTLVEVVVRRFYYGFTGFSGWMDEAVKWLTPIGNLGSWSIEFWVTENGYVIHGLDMVAVYAAAALALAGGAFLLYRARRLETAGDVVSVRPMRPVFQYGVAFCAGLVFGIGTAAILGGGELTLMASILVWAVIGCFAARMMLEKSFRVLRYWKGAAASAGVFVLLFLVVGFDLTGFETRVPAAGEVESVEINGFRLVHLYDGGDYFNAYENSEEIVNYTILLHQAAVDQRDDRPNEWNLANTTLSVTYHLKNGGELSRYYDNIWVDPSQADQEGTAAWAIQRIYDDRDLYWAGYGFERAERLLGGENGRVLEAVYEAYEDDGETQTRYYGGTEARALYEAVKEDFQAGRIGVRRVEDWNRNAFERRNLTVSFAGGENDTCSIEIRVQDTASSTLAALERLEREGAGQDYGTWTYAEGDLPPGMEHVDGPEVLEDGTVVAYPTVSAEPTAEPVS